MLNPTWTPVPSRPLVRVAAACITGYQRHLSPHKGFRCAHRVHGGGESCSQYVKRVLLEEGFRAAGVKARARFAACHQAQLALRAEGTAFADPGWLPGAGHGMIQAATYCIPFPGRLLLGEPLTRGLPLSITAYRLGYTSGLNAPQDAGIRASDAYVAAHDPLQASVDGADVVLGVDPGTYFCGGLTHWIAARGLRGGFVHLPPGDHHATTHAVVCRLIAALGPCERLLVTGFGPFPGVAWNPSGAYVATRADGRVLDLTGATDMAPVVAQLTDDFDAILALGVDSRQRLPRPRYTIETQSRGMGDPQAPWLGAEGLARAVWESGVFSSCR